MTPSEKYLRIAKFVAKCTEPESDFDAEHRLAVICDILGTPERIGALKAEIDSLRCQLASHGVFSEY